MAKEEQLVVGCLMIRRLLPFRRSYTNHDSFNCIGVALSSDTIMRLHQTGLEVFGFQVLQHHVSIESAE